MDVWILASKLSLLYLSSLHLWNRAKHSFLAPFLHNTNEVIVGMSLAGVGYKDHVSCLSALLYIHTTKTWESVLEMWDETRFTKPWLDRVRAGVVHGSKLWAFSHVAPSHHANSLVLRNPSLSLPQTLSQVLLFYQKSLKISGWSHWSHSVMSVFFSFSMTAGCPENVLLWVMLDSWTQVFSRFSSQLIAPYP